MVAGAESSGRSTSTGRGGWQGWLVRNRVMLALIVLAACICWLWVAATPPWRAPDEPAHFTYLEDMDRLQTVPLLGRAFYYPDLYESKNRTNFMGIFGYQSTTIPLETVEQNSAAGHPPLYYSLLLPAYELSSGSAMESQLYLLRVLGIAFFAALIGVAYRFAVLIFPRAPWFQAGVPLLMALHPQLAFVGSGVMNEILLVLLFTLFLYQLCVFALKDASLKRAALLGVIVGLGMLTKTSFIVAYPAGLAVLGVLLIMRPGQRLKIIEAAAIAAGVSFAICGWYFVRNYIELGYINPEGRVVRYNVGSMWDLWFATRFRAEMLGSFLGDFSWLTVPLYDNVLLWFRRLTELAAVGVVVALALGFWRRRALAPWLVIFFAALFAGFFLAASKFELDYGGAQGRYLFAAVFPFWSLMLVGLTGWLPVAWRRYGVALVVVAASCLSAWALMIEYLPRVS